MYGYQGNQAPFTQYRPQWQTPLELVRVSGIDGARAYQMPANSTVALFDGGQDVMYIKTTDGAGFPTIRAFSFSPLEPAKEAQPEYVTRREFEELKEAVINGKQSVRKHATDAGE